MEKRDLLERLADFDHCGLTAADRYHMRHEAWEEISKLREQIEQLQTSTKALVLEIMELRAYTLIMSGEKFHDPHH